MIGKCCGAMCNALKSCQIQLLILLYFFLSLTVLSFKRDFLENLFHCQTSLASVTVFDCIQLLIQKKKDLPSKAWPHYRCQPYQQTEALGLAPQNSAA
jgi:hypothetical protein